MLKAPYLVQRCTLEDGKVKYDYMGAAEFEVGDQAKSLRRIFAKGVAWNQVTVRVGGHEVIVGMVAAKDFPFVAYQPHLQEMADGGNRLHLHEPTYFDRVVRAERGLSVEPEYVTNIDIWFDFENDVFWVLSKNKRRALVRALERIERMWKVKEKEKEKEKVAGARAA